MKRHVYHNWRGQRTGTGESCQPDADDPGIDAIIAKSLPFAASAAAGMGIKVNECRKWTFASYVVGDSAGWHVDDDVRNGIIMIIQLSDPSNYVGGELYVRSGDATYHASRDRGAGTVFRSHIWHAVTEVTQGWRTALVLDFV